MASDISSTKAFSSFTLALRTDLCVDDDEPELDELELLEDALFLFFEGTESSKSTEGAGRASKGGLSLELPELPFLGFARFRFKSSSASADHPPKMPVSSRSLFWTVTRAELTTSLVNGCLVGWITSSPAITFFVTSSGLGRGVVFRCTGSEGTNWRVAAPPPM